MTAPSSTRTAYCLRCGRASRIVADSMDLRHPFVLCRRSNGDGDELGHGRVLGTYSLEEVDSLALERKRDRSTAHHDEHLRAGRLSAYCRRCLEEPPPSHARIHDYAPITERIKLASHLELSHADRRMRVNLYHRDVPADVAYHRALHDAALARREAAPRIAEPPAWPSHD